MVRAQRAVKIEATETFWSADTSVWAGRGKVQGGSPAGGVATYVASIELLTECERMQRCTASKQPAAEAADASGDAHEQRLKQCEQWRGEVLTH